MPVLRGAKHTIEKYKPVIFVEAHFHHAAELICYLNAIEYDCFWFISERYQANNYFNQPKTLQGMDYNLICYHRSAPRPDLFDQRLLATPDFNAQNIPLLSIN